MKTLALMTTAAVMTAGVSLANTQGDIINILQQQGYESVDVTRESGQIIFEAEQDGKMRELVYSSNGTLLEDKVTIMTSGETMLFPIPSDPTQPGIGDLDNGDDNVVVTDTADDQPELGVEIEEASGIAQDDLNDEAAPPTF